MNKKGFTLIELLVVIAIIAILAAILFPVFAQAKASAKRVACISNMKQMGTAIAMYLSDYDDTYSQAYYYRNDNGSAPDGNGVGGYTQWSGMLFPYVKNLDMFRCPADRSGGLAPTNFVGDNRGFGVPGGQTTQWNLQDDQAPRLSYTVNSMLMPRKRRTVDPMNTISATVVDGVAETILIAELTDIPSCINDTSSASGVAYKTHRSTNAIKMLDGTPFAGESTAQVGASAYRAISVVEAMAAFAACKATSALGQFHIAYIAEANRHAEGANYVYADTHAKFAKISQTLNPDRWQWGKRAYTAGGGAIYRPDADVEVR